MAELSEERNHDAPMICKVVFTGDIGVGKTSLLNR